MRSRSVANDVRADRIALSPAVRSSRVVAVLRAPTAEYLVDVARTLVSAGINSIEVTANTPGALDCVTRIRSALGDSVEIGVGTVVTVEDLQRALDVGIEYVVTPHVAPRIIEGAIAAGIPVIPGALTPTEVRLAWDLGASAVKIFPASMVGTKYIAHLRGPFQDIAFVPSGGVRLDTADEWLQVGCPAVSIGTPLMGDALVGGDLQQLRLRADRLMGSLSKNAGDDQC